MDNNSDIPGYINKNFFKTALENGFQKKNIEIIKFDIQLGTEPGDNYSSKIFRASVEYKEERSDPIVISVIIKSIPKGGAHDIIEYLDFYGKEENMYAEILPRMERLLKNTKIGAKCLYAVDKPLGTFVFEDLKVHGFVLGDRTKGLNEDECKIILEKLGKFHAASMNLLENDPDLLVQERYLNSLLTSETLKNPLVRNIFLKSLESEIAIVEKWPDFEKYVKKLKRIYENLEERLIDVAKPVKGELKVLTHGDLWVNNFMFKYSKDDPNKPLDALFVDFQGGYLVSPGMDINYFLNTSVQHNVIKNRRDVLIEDYYYKSLKETLIEIGSKKIPSLDDIKHEIKRKEFFGFISGVAVLPIICLDKDSSQDCSLEMLADEEQASKKRLLACQTKRFEEIMKYMLRRTDSLGILD